MSKIRFAPFAALVATLGYFVSSALTAAAMPLPPEPPFDPGSGAADAPAQATVVHDHVSTWTYALVAAAAIVATLLIVVVVSRLRVALRPAGA